MDFIDLPEEIWENGVIPALLEGPTLLSIFFTSRLLRRFILSSPVLAPALTKLFLGSNFANECASNGQLNLLRYFREEGKWPCSWSLTTLRLAVSNADVSFVRYCWENFCPVPGKNEVMISTFKLSSIETLKYVHSIPELKRLFSVSNFISGAFLDNNLAFGSDLIDFLLNDLASTNQNDSARFPLIVLISCTGLDEKDVATLLTGKYKPYFDNTMAGFRESGYHSKDSIIYDACKSCRSIGSLTQIMDYMDLGFHLKEGYAPVYCKALIGFLCNHSQNALQLLKRFLTAFPASVSSLAYLNQAYDLHLQQLSRLNIHSINPKIVLWLLESESELRKSIFQLTPQWANLLAMSTPPEIVLKLIHSFPDVLSVVNTTSFIQSKELRDLLRAKEKSFRSFDNDEIFRAFGQGNADASTLFIERCQDFRPTTMNQTSLKFFFGDEGLDIPCLRILLNHPSTKDTEDLSGLVMQIIRCPEVLKTAIHEFGYLPTEEYYAWALFRGDIGILDFLMSRGLKLPPTYWMHAIRGGDLRSLAWLKRQGVSTAHVTWPSENRSIVDPKLPYSSHRPKNLGECRTHVIAWVLREASNKHEELQHCLVS